MAHGDHVKTISTTIRAITLIIILGYLFSLPKSFAANGLYIEQRKLNASGEPIGNPGTMYLDRDKFRMEDNGSVTIGRLDRGQIWYFDTNDHTYFELPVMSNDTSDSQTKDLFVRTGKTRTIGEWQCHEVRLNPAKRSGWFEAIDSLTLWISEKPYSESTTYFASIFQAMGIDRSQLETVQSKIGNGFPIEAQIAMLGSITRMRVTKIESRPVSSVQFEPMPGYTKQNLDMPQDKLLRKQ